MPWHLLCVAFSICCFAFAAWQHASPMWNRVVAVGFALFALATLIP